MSPCLKPRLLLIAGVLSAGTAALASPVPGALASPVPGAAAQTRTGCGSAGVPALSVSSARSPRVTGSVLVTAAGRRITVGASRRSRAGTAAATWLDFCLRARAVARSVTLVNVAPGGVAIALTRNRELTVSTAARAGTGATRTVASATRAELVQVLLDRRLARASVFVNGGRRASMSARIPATVNVLVGGGASTATAGPADAPAVSAAGHTPTAFAASSPTSPTKSTTKAGSVTTTSTIPATTTPTTPAPAGVTAAVASSAGAEPSNPFAATSFWNAPLASTTPIDPNSQSYVHDLVSQVNQYGAWMNTNWYSVPLYVVPAGQPTVKVTLNTWGPDLQQQWNAVPIPPGATAANGTDKSMAVWQPSTDKMWDFWLMQQASGAWSARWGGEMDNVSSSQGYFTHSGQTNNWGATATGLALAGGLITLADLKRGYINHALAIALPQTEAGVFSWPAQRTDGKSTAATALPEGIRFRLDPSINVAALGLPWLDRIIAQAAQTYGIVVRDTSGAVTLYAQDPTPTGSNPWAAPFDGWSEGTFLSWLPWSHLEALQTQLAG